MPGSDFREVPGINVITSVLPLEQQATFDAINRTRFGPAAIGSRFTALGSLQELLTEAVNQRGNLDGDDRQKLLSLGASPESLMDDCRYLLVHTPGKVGIQSIETLSPDTQINLIQTKPGVPRSLVVDVDGDNFPETNDATIIIGPNEKENPNDPEPTTKEMVWTVHPGLPIKPAQGDIEDWNGKNSITPQEVMEKLGKSIFVKLRVKEE